MLDTEELQQAGTSLRFVATEFDGADARSQDVAAAVGHAGLAGAVEDFASSWDDGRAKMVEAIASLAEVCTGIGEGFEELDTAFAAALRGEG